MIITAVKAQLISEAALGISDLETQAQRIACEDDAFRSKSWVTLIIDVLGV